MMKVMTYVFIYLLFFFAVGWVCGYNPLEICQILSALSYDSKLNGFEARLLPKGGGMSVVAFLLCVYALGVFSACVIEACKTRMNFLLFRKNIFIGLVCVGVFVMLFQLSGHVLFLKTYLRVDVQSWAVHEKQLGEFLDLVTKLAQRVHRRYSGQPVTVQIDMEQDCGEDPCLYIKRALRYYLYPVDTGEVRNEMAREVLKPLSRFGSD